MRIKQDNSPECQCRIWYTQIVLNTNSFLLSMPNGNADYFINPVFEIPTGTSVFTLASEFKSPLVI